jgi:hypothetical protein
MQALVLGELIGILNDNANLKTFTLQNWLLAAATFLVIILIWNEYMMGLTIFRWVPQLKDSILPFAIGVSENFVVHNINTNLYSWCYAMSIFCLIGYIAYVNMYRSADPELHPENADIFKKLNELRKKTEDSALWFFLTFALIGLISHVVDNSIVQEIMAFLPLIMIVAFLYWRSTRYWKRIIDKYFLSFKFLFLKKNADGFSLGEKGKKKKI